MERVLDLQAGFLPYTDESGFAVSVCLRLDKETSAPELLIECNAPFSVDCWPQLRDGIERLLKALPNN